MSTSGNHESIVYPRDVCLTPVEVMARYRWGRTKRYQVMRNRTDGFRCAIGGRHRLDNLLAWEDRQFTGDSAQPGDPWPPRLPPRKRSGHRTAR